MISELKLDQQAKGNEKNGIKTDTLCMKWIFYGMNSGGDSYKIESPERMEVNIFTRTRKRVQDKLTKGSDLFDNIFVLVAEGCFESTF